MNVLLSLCSLLMNRGVSESLKSTPLHVEFSLGQRFRKRGNVGYDACGGAQGELHTLRSMLSKNHSIVSGAHGSNFPKAQQLEKGEPSEVQYMIRSNQLMKSTEAWEKADKDDMKTVEALLWSTLKRFPNKIGDTDFAIILGDLVHDLPQICKRVLCFTFSSARTSTHSVLGFPNPYYICQAFTVMRSHDMMQSKKLVPWQRKKNKAFFIGSMTKGRSQTVEEVEEQPRVRLASIAARNPQKFDVLWTDIDWSDWRGNVTEEKHANRRLAKVLTDAFKKEKHNAGLDLFEVSPKYKYLLDIDGVTVSWRGYQLLGAESVVLLQDSVQGEFFFHDLKPWVHYVPLKHDLSDVVEKIQYLEDNDEVAFKIAKAARLFWMQDLSFGATQCWTREALKVAQEVASPKDTTDGFEVVPHMSDKHVERLCHRAVID